MYKDSGTFVFYRPRPKRQNPGIQLEQLNHFNRQVEHELYQCSVYCWLAEGFYRNELNHLRSCYFLFIEYRNTTGASQYHSEQFLSLNQALTWLETRVSTITLPDLCSLNTRDNPVQTRYTTEEFRNKPPVKTTSQSAVA